MTYVILEYLVIGVWSVNMTTLSCDHCSGTIPKPMYSAPHEEKQKPIFQVFVNLLCRGICSRGALEESRYVQTCS